MEKWDIGYEKKYTKGKNCELICIMITSAHGLLSGELRHKRGHPFFDILRREKKVGQVPLF